MEKTTRLQNKLKLIILVIILLLSLSVLLGVIFQVKPFGEPFEESCRPTRSIKIRANMNSFGVMAELYFDSHNNSYTGFENDPQIPSIKKHIEKCEGKDFAINVSLDGEQYCVKVSLPFEASMYCVDSTGYSGSEANCSAENIGCKKISLAPTPVACTNEAKLCPDGSAVGRVGPNCEFAPCPTTKPEETANWKTYRNEKYGFEFKYPNDWTALEDFGVYITNFLYEGPGYEFRYIGKDAKFCTFDIVVFPITAYGQDIRVSREFPQKETEITINYRQAIRFDFEEIYGDEHISLTSVYLNKDNNYYRITRLSERGAYEAGCLDTFNHSLSTFKFLD